MILKTVWLVWFNSMQFNILIHLFINNLDIFSFVVPRQRRLESDFLGVSKSENQSDLAAINEIRSNDSDYLFTNNSLVPMQNQVVDTLAMSIKKMLIAIYNHWHYPWEVVRIQHKKPVVKIAQTLLKLHLEELWIHSGREHQYIVALRGWICFTESIYFLHDLLFYFCSESM